MEKQAIPPYMDYDVRTEETMEEIKVNIPKGYEFTGVDDDKQQVVFTKIGYHYPKTYEECCKGLYFEEMNRFKPFVQLLRCREAYWKIAGEQMRLSELWKPDWTDSEFKYCIKVIGNKLECVSEMNIQCILSFPAKEMRDAFYENFKELIEECKEFL